MRERSKNVLVGCLTLLLIIFLILTAHLVQVNRYSQGLRWHTKYLAGIENELELQRYQTRLWYEIIMRSSKRNTQLAKVFWQVMDTPEIKEMNEIIKEYEKMIETNSIGKD